MYGLLGYDNIWEMQLFENLESEGAKNQALRKSPLKLSKWTP